MSTATQDKPAETRERKKKGTLLWILLIIFLILFALTSVILGSRLYNLATRDKYSVDLGMGTNGEIDLFKIEYENASGEITVQGLNGQNVVAPGTSVSYDVRLRNREEDCIIDFVMTPHVKFLTEDQVPVRFKLMDSYGNWLLGSDTEWVGFDSLNALAHRGSIHPGEVFTYFLTWEWVFEVSPEQDAYDTYLGNQNGEILPGVEVSFTTESTANPSTTKHTFSMMHILGEGWGCCWCCWLVWILLLVIVVLLFWVWRLRRKMNKQVDTLEEYEQVLTAHGLLVDGKLVDQIHA